MELPKFEVDTAIESQALQILHLSEGFDEYATSDKFFHIRKANRIKSIQSSLAIEANSLTLEQVTDIINGKKVIGDEREITEVKNAWAGFGRL
jgi:Fic family protein